MCDDPTEIPKPGPREGGSNEIPKPGDGPPGGASVGDGPPGGASLGDELLMGGVDGSPGGGCGDSAVAALQRRMELAKREFRAVPRTISSVDLDQYAGPEFVNAVISSDLRAIIWEYYVVSLASLLHPYPSDDKQSVIPTIRHISSETLDQFKNNRKWRVLSEIHNDRIQALCFMFLNSGDIAQACVDAKKGSSHLSASKYDEMWEHMFDMFPCLGSDKQHANFLVHLNPRAIDKVLTTMGADAGRGGWTITDMPVTCFLEGRQRTAVLVTVRSHYRAHAVKVVGQIAFGEYMSRKHFRDTKGNILLCEPALNKKVRKYWPTDGGNNKPPKQETAYMPGLERLSEMDTKESDIFELWVRQLKGDTLPEDSYSCVFFVLQCLIAGIFDGYHNMELSKPVMMQRIVNTLYNIFRYYFASPIHKGSLESVVKWMEAVGVVSEIKHEFRLANGPLESFHSIAKNRYSHALALAHFYFC